MTRAQTATLEEVEVLRIGGFCPTGSQQEWEFPGLAKLVPIDEFGGEEGSIRLRGVAKDVPIVATDVVCGEERYSRLWWRLPRHVADALKPGDLVTTPMRYSVGCPNSGGVNMGHVLRVNRDARLLPWLKDEADDPDLGVVAVEAAGATAEGLAQAREKWPERVKPMEYNRILARDPRVDRPAYCNRPPSW